MYKQPLKTLGITAVLFLISACGGNASSGGGGGGTAGGNPSGNAGSTSYPGATPVPEATFREQAADLYCGALQTCCEQAGLSFSPVVCQSLTGQVVPSGVGATYHEDAAGSCLQLLRSGTCDSSDMPSPCKQVYTGSKALGQACSGDADCAPRTDGEVTCDVFDGVCAVVRRGELNEACNASCEELEDIAGYACSNFDNAAVGANTTVQCYRNDGLTCDSAMTCTALVGLGESCTSDRECVDGAFCGASTTSTTSVCTASLPVGSACMAFRDECVTSAYCDENNTCAPRKADGQPCSNLPSECQGQCSNNICEAQGDLAAGFLALFCVGAFPTTGQ